MGTATLARPTTCIFCRRKLTDGRIESGYTGEGPDWMDNGDFGCDDNPGTNQDGCYGHVGRSDIVARLKGLEREERDWIMERIDRRTYGF